MMSANCIQLYSDMTISKHKSTYTHKQTKQGKNIYIIYMNVNISTHCIYYKCSISKLEFLGFQFTRASPPKAGDYAKRDRAHSVRNLRAVAAGLQGRAGVPFSVFFRHRKLHRKEHQSDKKDMMMPKISQTAPKFGHHFRRLPKNGETETNPLKQESNFSVVSHVVLLC